MKTITSLVTLLFSVICLGQNDLIFTHIANPGSGSSDYISEIDHPDLNDNPDAVFFVTHVYNPGGTGGILNDNQTGTWYNSSSSRWTVFNEDFTPIVIDAAYNIYVANEASTIATTTDGSSYTLVIDDARVNNNPDANLISSKHWNPNGVYNTQNYGFWYDDGDGKWNLYTEDIANQPNGAAYNILLEPGQEEATIAFKHTATQSNIQGNWTYIDHPLLNGNPNAHLIVQHNWGTSGDAANILHDHVIGVWYSAGQWAIYNEDQTPFIEDLEFNVYVYDELLSTNDLSGKDFSLYPVPAKDHLFINSAVPIERVEVFNVLGKQIKDIDPLPSAQGLNISSLSTGIYLLKISTNNSSTVKKFIKE